jgi:hypothetical protein
VSVVRQRADGDCGVAALGAYSGEAYEDAYVAVAAVDRKYRGKNGLHNHQLVAAAKLMDIVLEPTRRFDLDEDEGVLRIRWNDPRKRRGGHFVAVVNGFIRCPSGEERGWREYLDIYGGRACTLLKGSGG